MNEKIFLTIRFQNTITNSEPQRVQLIQDLLKTYLNYWKALKIKEWSAFLNFVESPIHKQTAYSAKLIERIKEALRKETSELRGEELISKYTSAQARESNAGKLQKLAKALELLIELIQKFLVYTEAIENPQTQQYLLVKSLKQRKNNDLFQLAAVQFENSLQGMPSTIMVNLDRWWLAYQRYYHKYAEQHVNTETFEQNLTTWEALDQLLTLRNYLEYLNRSALTQIPQKDLEQKAWALIKKEQLAPPLNLYRLLIRLQTSQSEEKLKNYAEFREIYPQVCAQLAPVDQLILIKTYINCLVYLYYQEGGDWLKETFSWMQYLSKEGLYTLEGNIADDDYLNFFFTAHALKEQKVYRDFEQKNLPLLDPNIQEQVRGLCRVYSLKTEHKLAEALKTLDQYFPLGSKEDLKYNLRAKEFRVMIHYELLPQKDDGDLSKAIDNLHKFCQRLAAQVLTEATITPHFGFVKMVQKMVQRHYLAPDKTSLKKQLLDELKELIASKKQLAHRSWLVEQINKLK